MRYAKQVGWIKTSSKYFWFWDNYPSDNCPWTFAPRIITPLSIAPRIIAPQIITSRKIATRAAGSRIITLENYPPNNSPPDNYFQLIASDSSSRQNILDILSKFEQISCPTREPFFHAFIWFWQLYMTIWPTISSSQIFEQNFYISTKRLKNVFAYLQLINFVVWWIRGSDQLRCIIKLENLKVPFKMSLGRSHVKLLNSSSHEWIR